MQNRHCGNCPSRHRSPRQHAAAAAKFRIWLYNFHRARANTLANLEPFLFFFFSKSSRPPSLCTMTVARVCVRRSTCPTCSKARLARTVITFLRRVSRNDFISLIYAPCDVAVVRLKHLSKHCYDRFNSRLRAPACTARYKRSRARSSCFVSLSNNENFHSRKKRSFANRARRF